MWWIILSFFISLGSQAEEPKFSFDVQKFVTAIKQMKKEAAFPILAIPISRDQTPLATPLPVSLQNRFKELNKALFGQESVFTLTPCERCDFASVQLDKLVVWLNPKHIEAMLKDGNCDHPEDTLDFVLAHELSHYAYELWFNRNGRSIFGQDSSYADEDSVKKAWRHAEVDSYALALMQAMKKDTSCAIHFLDALTKEKTSQDLITTDAKIRKQSADNLKSLGIIK